MSKTPAIRFRPTPSQSASPWLVRTLDTAGDWWTRACDTEAEARAVERELSAQADVLRVRIIDQRRRAA